MSAFLFLLVFYVNQILVYRQIILIVEKNDERFVFVVKKK